MSRKAARRNGADPGRPAAEGAAAGKPARKGRQTSGKNGQAGQGGKPGASRNGASPAMAFAVERLRKDPDISFGALKAAAQKKGLAIVPIVYGRAKLALGLQRKAEPRAPEGEAETVAPNEPAPLPRRRGSRAVADATPTNSLQQVIDIVRIAEAQRQALAQIQMILDSVPALRRGPGRPRRNAGL